MLKAGFFDLLMVSGVIFAGESVVAATECGDFGTEVTRLEFFGALEHHVLKYVSHTGGAVLFIHRPDAIPHHMGDRWSAFVFLHDDAHAIGKFEFLRMRCGVRAHRQQGKCEKAGYCQLRKTKFHGVCSAKIGADVGNTGQRYQHDCICLSFSPLCTSPGSDV